VDQLKCEWCGGGIAPRERRHGRPQRFCSSRCCQKSYNANKYGAHEFTGTCEVCGGPTKRFKMTGGSAMVCSAECRKKLPRQVVRTCPDCGQERQTTKKNSVRCIACHCKRNRQRGGVCEECGKSFMSTGITSRFCSKRCRRRADSIRKRTRLSAAYVEPVPLDYLIERDGGRCRLCGKAVKLNARWPDPLSPSCDHIVPLSKGGQHRKDNCQLAHLGCNVKMSNKKNGKQLRLIG
jgi:hypothetical protein